jgi:hypothetical protein
MTKDWASSIYWVGSLVGFNRSLQDDKVWGKGWARVAEVVIDKNKTGCPFGTACWYLEFVSSFRCGSERRPCWLQPYGGYLLSSLLLRLRPLLLP